MASIMGAHTVVAGFQPGVVSSLVELDADTSGVHAALDMDDAFRLIAEHHDVPEPTDTTHGEADDEPPTDADEDCD